MSVNIHVCYCVHWVIMEPVCVSCGLPFKRRKSNGYHRYNLLKVSTCLSAKTIFPNVSNRNGFICGDCCNLFRKHGKGNAKGQYIVSESASSKK